MIGIQIMAHVYKMQYSANLAHWFVIFFITIELINIKFSTSYIIFKYFIIKKN
jgi:uncharacterized membrane protein AbrB (regulator of aidB expression)